MTAGTVQLGAFLLVPRSMSGLLMQGNWPLLDSEMRRWAVVVNALEKLGLAFVLPLQWVESWLWQPVLAGHPL